MTKKKRAKRKIHSIEDEAYANAIKTEKDLIEGGYDKQEEDVKIRVAINKLPDKYRRVVYFFYLEELSLKEVSEEMGISVGSVKTRLTRGRKMLKEELITLGIT